MNRCGAVAEDAEMAAAAGCVRGEGHRGVHRDAYWQEWGVPEIMTELKRKPGEELWT